MRTAGETILNLLGYNLSAQEKSMNGFLAGLPWNLSALAALIVIAAGFLAELDPWIALERSGLAFIAFWFVGLIGRSMFGATSSRNEDSGNAQRAGSKEQQRSE